jgi:magnesium chelatase family protein
MGMLAKVCSCTTVGLEPFLIEVEVDVSGGLPHFDIVGLPDVSVRESKERVRTAIKNAGYVFPPRRITVNLAPADLKKEGPGFDLAIAVGILAATEQLGTRYLSDYVLVGELSLDGALRPVPGILPMALFLQKLGGKGFLIPADNSREASLIPLSSYGLKDLPEVCRFLADPGQFTAIERLELRCFLSGKRLEGPDLEEVKGQKNAKRALEIAAAGGHNILFAGPPGSGKSMLARCLPSILPPLTEREALETSEVYSIGGFLTPEHPLITQRPFRAPHHTASPSAMIGGGMPPRPGEVTLAAHGVLFLDELPEFRRDVLESLRQPLEDRSVTLTRVHYHTTFPAHFQLVAAANPCPCGYYGDPQKECTCTPYQVEKYRNRISGPLLDRIDMHVEVPRVTFRELDHSKESGRTEETSAQVRQQVIRAREIQLRRFGEQGISCNALMGNKEVKKYCTLAAAAKKLLQQAFTDLGFSARAYHRILKIARTIADLEGCGQIATAHVAEAVYYRSFDKK